LGPTRQTKHTHHNPTTPRMQTTTLARRNASKRLNPPPPSWGETACRTKTSNHNLIPNSFPNLQILKPPIVPHWLRTFRRADPKSAPGRGATEGVLELVTAVLSNLALHLLHFTFLHFTFLQVISLQVSSVGLFAGYPAGSVQDDGK
jgi:hypothetical protein